MKRQRVTNSLMYLLVWFTAALFSLPLLVMVSGSLKTSSQLTRDPHGLWPEIWTWGNYPDGIAFAVLLANAVTPYLDRRGALSAEATR